MIEKWEEKYADVMEHEIVTSQQIQRWQDEEIELLRAENERLKEASDFDHTEYKRLRDAQAAEIERLREALVRIEGHRSFDPLQQMRRIARNVLEPLKPCTSDEWLANCPQSVRDLANKIKQEKK